MGKTQTIAHPNFETVWATLQEVTKIQKEASEEAKKDIKEIREILKEADRWIAERQKETDRQLAEQKKEAVERQKETDRQLAEQKKEAAERQKEIDRQIKDYNKRFGDLTRRFGEVVEYMIAPNLQEKFRELGLNFPKTGLNIGVSDFDNDILLEIDALLENGEKAMLTEIKTKLTTEDVKDHVKRLEKMRAYADLHGDKRRFLGAVAGVVMTPYAKKYALGQGLYLVEPSGETFNIIPPEGTPKEW